MDRNEFLEKLQHALGNDLETALVRENVEFYNSYIQDEVRKGRLERDVIEELGDPWVVAQTVIDAKLDDRSEYVEPVRERYTYADDVEDANGRYEGGFAENIHTFAIDTWWKRLLLILSIVLIVVLVVTIVGGILSVVVPFIIPVIAVLFVIRIVKHLIH